MKTIMLIAIIALVTLSVYKKQEHIKSMRSYQFQITDQDHALLYDGDKLVGRFKFTNTALDSLITKDNL